MCEFDEMKASHETDECIVETEVLTEDRDCDTLDPPADLVFDKVVADEAHDVDDTSVNNTPEWLEDYITSTQSHLQNLRSLIKYTKTKDESIYKLSNELQKYREDYCFIHRKQRKNGI